MDATRSLVGDKDPANPLLDDAEYARFLADAGGNVRRAAHMAALALEAKWATQADKTTGDLRESLSQVAASYGRLATNLLASAGGDEAGVVRAAPLAGGITDPVTGDIIDPFFTRDIPY